jgi:DNA-directed RNA polymerase specialized sigma54-like protein
MWLVRAIRQRARSYLKLARTIVSLVPPEALTDGSTELPKIKLRDLATTLGMHESTIVRMTGADQRMRAPRGDVPFLAFLKTR